MSDFPTQHISKIVKRLSENQHGSATVEYAMLLGLIAATLLPVVQLLGVKVKSVNQTISDILVGDVGSESAEPTTTEPPVAPESEPNPLDPPTEEATMQ
jgi:Flp pilus assembly pilin Flp